MSDKINPNQGNSTIEERGYRLPKIPPQQPPKEKNSNGNTSKQPNKK